LNGRKRRLSPQRAGERNHPESDRKAAALGYIGSPPLSARAGTGAVGIEEATMHTTIPTFVGFAKAPWNKGRLIGQKRPLKPKDVWAIRVRLQLEGRKRDLALFNLAIDSKLRGCDLVSLQVDDVSVGGRVRDRATVIQKKTGRPVQFEITEQTRSAIRDWVSEGNLQSGHYLFPGSHHGQPHLSTRQYARIVHSWVERAGLDSSAYGTHSLRRTKAAQIYRKTGNLRAVQLLLGHTKLESTVRYLGIKVDDALSIAEQVEL
jgi:integrase